MDNKKDVPMDEACGLYHFFKFSVHRLVNF